MTFLTNSPGETEKLGEALALRLRPGDVVAYRGDLGAGKPAFTRGLAEGLGVRELHSADDLFDIGWEDYLERGGVCAVEWSENVEEALESPIRVTIRHGAQGPDCREITIEGGEQLADLSL